MQWALTEKEPQMKVKAIKPCFYGMGRDTGEVFEADDRFGHLLIRLGSVTQVQAEEADKPEKRAYKRKDMQAEGSAK